MARIPAGSFLAFLALFILTESSALAQSSPAGRLTGNVTDPSGASIPGAAIVAKHSRTGAEFGATSDGLGAWVIPSVPSGTYTVQVTAQGFMTASFKGIEIGTGGVAEVNATLQIGLADTVLVTASRFAEEVVNAPATATVVSEQAIRDSPTQNVADLLRAVPGVNLAQTAARDFGITIRAANRVQPGAGLVLINGRTIYRDYLGYIGWDTLQIGLEDVQQVEVIRSPASAVWGANAMLGVINIVTKSPRQMLGTTMVLGIGTFDRSGGAADSDRGSLYYVNAAHAQALNDRWAVKITGGAYTQDAFARPQGAMPNAYRTPYPSFKNEGTTQPKVDARVDYDLPDGRRHFTFAGGFASGDGIIHSGIGPFRLIRSGKASYGEADYVRGALRVMGYVNVLEGHASNLLLLAPTGQPVQQDVKTQVYDVEFSNSGVVIAKHLISYGGSLRHTEFQILLAPEGKSRNEAGAYFQDEILLSEHFRWAVGMRVDRFDILKGAVFSPRTSFMIKPAPSQSFRVSYSRAYMAPSMFQKYMQIPFMRRISLGMIDPRLAGSFYNFPVSAAGNRDIKEQSLNGYEVGYSGRVAKGRASLGAAFYLNDSKGDFRFFQIGSYTSQNPPPAWPLPPAVLDALIAANAFGPGKGLPSILSPQNLGRLRNKGLELNAEARLSRYVTGFANYSWQAKPRPKDYDISILNLPPAQRFNAGAGIDYNRWLGNVSVGYVGSAYWNDVIDVTFSGTSKAYTVVNAGAGVRWGSAGRYMTTLKVANLANTPVQNHVFGDILKRQITGEFRIRF
jgi:outer membrane receptor protein involved in Fe transport